MDFSALRVVHDHDSAMMIPGFLHYWKPNIEILAVSGMALRPMSAAVLIVNSHAPTAKYMQDHVGDQRACPRLQHGDFSEVSKGFDGWRTAGGWRLEKLFLVMEADDGKHLDWQYLQPMLNKIHFPRLRSINIIQVGGRKVSLPELPWVTDSTTLSIRFIDRQNTPQFYARYLPASYI
ncbi:uncharacterized protein LACBIDRAFT_324494 [Laccaria bicolor S238N-H82]|nr:uncharacterized protein LACBIDRAFT_324494 [Laccaria bicolor S238N-H82]EDR12079.1 predicted protein [Laccaria bicolor S238N-H82]|eukprot:XP_001877976.1 predicted protein [Laccaria bicolor S238N-H82]